MNNKKNFLLGALCAVLISQCNAVWAAPYAGVDGGLIFTKLPEDAAFQSKVDIFASRFYAGYKFLPFFGLEVGYDAFQNSKFGGNNHLGPDHFHLSGSDLTAKFILPMTFISLYSTAGLVYLKQDAQNVRFAGQQPIYENHGSAVLPSMGMGIMFNFTSHFSVNLGYTHVFEGNNIKSVDFIPLGITFYI